MNVKDEYLQFKISRDLKTGNFKDRVILQELLKSRLELIWDEEPKFSNGGLLSNYMTRYAIGFAYYDCEPSSFCKRKCYGLPISGLHDYYMLRLGVITSESLKTKDIRFIRILENKLRELNLRVLKIGHWGDAVLKQVPNMVEIVNNFPNTKFWWYTRKINVAIAANEYKLRNLKVYLSLDPNTHYPSYKEYPFGITYLFGEEIFHKNHDEILKDDRLVAIFPLKKGKSIESPSKYKILNHPKICIEKKLKEELGEKGNEICLFCSERCNYNI